MAKKSEAVSAWATQTAAAWAGEVERVGKLVKLGMGEAEVIKALGKPSSSAAGGTLFYPFAFAAPPFWDEGEAFPVAALGLSLSKKKYAGRLQLEWSAGDPNASFPEGEFHAVVTALAALFAKVHGPAAKAKGKMKEFNFPEAKGVQLTVRGGINYQTAQLTIGLQPA